MGTVRSRRVVVGGEERPATIRFEDGVIVEVGEGSADVDFGDLVILPGLVDSHVHVNEPGRTEWEGFATATAAALAGGTTTIVDMPLNSIPPTVDEEALEAKRQAAVGQVHTDVAFWGGVIPGSENGMSGLVDAGACGFKVFTVDSGVPEFPPLDPALLGAVAARAGEFDVPLLVHAEDPSLLEDPHGDPRSYSNYLRTRPGRAEASAIRSMSELPARVHILHVAGAAAADAVTEIRRRSAMTAETCPHYLTFDAGSIPDGATAFKCAPPIRDAEDRDALWDALATGAIDMVVSDHSPAPPRLKDVEGGDFIAAWGGIASVELRLAATWDGARARGHGLPELARWLAEAPASLAGLVHRKGEIAVGLDADLVVFDPDGVTEVVAGRMRQRHPLTPYDGMRLAGSVAEVYLGGEPVFGVNRPPGGRLLKRGE